MSALVARDRTGRGQHVEVSLLQGVLSLTTQIWNWTDRGQFLLPKAKSTIAGVHQASIYECANGEWIHASTMSGVPSTRSEADILGLEEVSPAQLWAMPPDAREDYEARRREAFKRWDRDKLVEEFHAAGLGAEAIVAPPERFAHPQLRQTGGVVQVDDPDVGQTTQSGVMIFLEATPGEVRGPQPRPGRHTDEVLRSLGHDDNELAALRERGVI
jgi:crotonobetainyl-CoA:carnitine CoA-transferase CaiB-like acyl-CoA transferase